MKLKRVAKWGGWALALALVAFLVAYWMSDNECPATVEGGMRAIVYCDYGTSEVLRLEQVEKPVPADDEVLVRVRAAAVNPRDWHYMSGTP